MIERIHFSKELLASLDDRSYLPCTERFKPVGLWYSVEGAVDEDGRPREDGWSDWCRSEDFGIGEYAHRLELDLERMLVVESPWALDDLGAEICLGRWECDWASLTTRYAGIEIAPYFWSRRLNNPTGNTNWYYSWDCASGCVWDTSAILKFEPLGEWS